MHMHHVLLGGITHFSHLLHASDKQVFEKPSILQTADSHSDLIVPNNAN